MSQVVLGLRSLAIRLAIFVVMAALLAWALGGTLFPKPRVVDLEHEGVLVGSTTYFWRLTIDAHDEAVPQWQFVAKSGKSARLVNESRWIEAAGPVLCDTGIYYAGRSGDHWILCNVEDASAAVSLPDRLAVEQQFARLQSGLPVQDAKTIMDQRLSVLDPTPPNADHTE